MVLVAGGSTFQAASRQKKPQAVSLATLKATLDRLAKPAADPPSLLRMEFHAYPVLFMASVMAEVFGNLEDIIGSKSAIDVQQEVAKRFGRAMARFTVEKLNMDLDKMRVRLVIKAGEALSLQVECPTEVFKLVPLLK
jgi:hypothetical protein